LCCEDSQAGMRPSVGQDGPESLDLKRKMTTERARVTQNQIEVANIKKVEVTLLNTSILQEGKRKP